MANGSIEISVKDTEDYADLYKENKFLKWKWALMSSRKELPDRQLLSNVFYKNHVKNFRYKDFNIPQIQFETIDALRDLFESRGKRVFIIGAGPSLNKNIDEFCKNYNPGMGVVVATDSSIHELAKRRFKPDFVMSSEGDSKETAATHVPTTEDLLDTMDRQFYYDVPLIASSWCNNLFVSRWPCREVYYYCNFDERYEQYILFNDRMWPNGRPYDLPRLAPRTSMVGFHAIALAEYFKCDEVVLLGFDCCTYPKCPKCGNRDVERKQVRNETISCSCGYEGMGDTIHHTDDFPMDWDTEKTNLKASYEQHFMWFLTRFDGCYGIKTINCTEGGALTEGATDGIVMSLADKFKEINKG